MKTTKEIEQLANDKYKDNLHNRFFTAAPMGYINGYTQCQEDMQPLLKDLFDLWERLAEAGELSIGLNFTKKYDELKKLINKKN